ncbi:ACP S-malonyltransferase [Parafrankia sp. EUN1f]|uniref:ACP S-malonyltransferase n=1 Tax=Parafrankia sp. EUN1f TaxID=102897 RepID=UPI0001C463BE|nr:ACP S-malonyltransferase [Parafrankia sp. EUN1f]EFC81300.1 malonyl CoA-acyl carrier protein transacylase [Parafrankia sp. EUN1f]
MKVIGFPGQGAQKAGMGADLFADFGELVAAADAVLGYSVAELCVENPDGALLLTQHAQPALYVVEALAYLRHRQADPTPPDYLLGHSIGEFAALFAAGVFDFVTGLRLVARRGELMSRCTGGTMAAVLGLAAEEVDDLLARPGLAELDVALYNAPGQIVLAGPEDAVDTLLRETAGTAVRAVRLNVSGPFHSRYMKPAAVEFERYAREFDLAPPEIPVIANVTARPHVPDEIAHTLARQICEPVQWERSIRLLLAAGEFDLVELGPGKTLAGMVDRIRGKRLRAVA